MLGVFINYPSHMYQKILPTILLLITVISCQPTAQTYVGEVLYRNSYQYIKIKCERDTCLFSMPYLDNDLRYPTEGLPLQQSNWKVQRGIEKWVFNTTAKAGKLTGSLKLPTGQQTVSLIQQLPAISSDSWDSFNGVYEDANQKRAIIYATNNYLHLMSPYSEESMSLKPIGENKFWSVSGEYSTFNNLHSSQFQSLTITDRFGEKKQLKRLPPIEKQELWIPVGKDTLYAQLYLPASSGQVPACLVLPGGGAIGLDNYIYEARFLAANGVASLVFDKPGNGRSKGQNHFTRQSFEEKNEQYKSLFQYLKQHPKVDPNKVGIHGPSEGGRLALLMAIDLKDEVAFVNAVAAPLMTLREGQLYAIDHYLRNLGLEEKTIVTIQDIWNDYYDGILNDKIDQETIDRANEYRQLHPRLFIPPNSTQIPVSPKKEDIPNNRVVTEANKIECPILLQYGENDQRVNPYKSLQNFTPKVQDQALLNTIIYDRGTHSMMTPEYKICPGYTEDKIKWLKLINIL